MSNESDPIAPDLLTALRTAVPLTEAPVDAKARVLSTVLGRIAAIAPPGSPSGGDGHGGGGGPPAVPNVVPRPPWLSAPWLAVPGALVLGGILGSLLRGPGPERIIYVDRVVTAVAPSSQPAAPDPGSSPVPVESLPLAATPSRSVPAPADSGQMLAAESKLLDVARTSLAHGEADHALAAVDRHAAQFPRGMLAEEREALAVKALVLAGNGDAARARASQFRARYPESLFLPAVDSALHSLR